MATTEKTVITVEATVIAPIDKVWKAWTDPAHVVQWNNATEEWHTPKATNDLREGGRFSFIMAAKDGSMEFDFNGTYEKIITNKLIEYTLEDGRKVKITFEPIGGQTKVTESFEAEGMNPIEMQEAGWQAILNNFKKYVESLAQMVKMHFEVLIAAPVEKVYEMMLGTESFKAWTAEFNPGSHFRGAWEKGAKLLFIGVDEEGNEGGMVSRVKEIIPNQFVSIEHLGILKGKEEITSGPEVEGWAGALENYTYVPEGDNTRVLVDVDTNLEFKAYFEDTWPKALNLLKSICEA